MHIKVLHCASKSQTPVGTEFDEYESEVLTIGRSSKANVTLRAPTVSRLHARLSSSGEGFVVHNLSERGATYVQGRRLKPEETFHCTDSIMQLQIGCILLEVREFSTTKSWDSKLTASPILEFKGSARTPQVLICGSAVHLSPSPARLLLCLASSPGFAVPYDTLRNKVLADEVNAHIAGGPNITQMITYIRNAFIRTMEADDNVRLQMIDLVSESQSSSNNNRTLARRVISNSRGHGYILNMKPVQIAIPDNLLMNPNALDEASESQATPVKGHIHPI